MKYVKVLFTIGIVTHVLASFALEQKAGESLGSHFMRVKGIEVSTNESLLATWNMPMAVTVGTNVYCFVQENDHMICNRTNEVRYVRAKKCSTAYAAVETMCENMSMRSTCFAGIDPYFQYKVVHDRELIFVQFASWLGASYGNLFVIIKFGRDLTDLTQRMRIAEAIIRSGLLPPSL